ncbi:hypothetical protein [Endozoicomonas sp.]|uniref:hypothetical protein n=1 Tax=Endozoicomonas sp. TaxID=1892382 RepID=UPI00383B87A9
MNRGRIQNDNSRKYMYQGCQSNVESDFERRFRLADCVRVTGAAMDNGLPHIDLECEIPEAMKPRKINIGQNKLLEAEA